MITNEGTGFDSSYIAGIFEYQHILKEIDKWFNQDPTSTLTFKNNLSEILSRPSRLNVEGWLCLCYSYSKNQISLKVHNFKDWLNYGDFSENEAIVTFDDIWLYPLNNDSVFLKKFESGIISAEEVKGELKKKITDIMKWATITHSTSQSSIEVSDSIHCLPTFLNVQNIKRINILEMYHLKFVVPNKTDLYLERVYFTHLNDLFHFTKEEVESVFGEELLKEKSFFLNCLE